MTDPYVEANCKLLRERSEAGRRKYGVDLTRQDLSPQQWIQHAIEEHLDAANYLQRLKSVIDAKDAQIEAMRAQLALFQWSKG